MTDGRVGVLFVCLGNICRSPLAEAVFRSLVAEAGLEAHFDIDSAGTSGYHDGEGADARTIAEAMRRGVRVDSSSRRITESDFVRFQHVVAMDADNLARVSRVAQKAAGRAALRRLRDFDPEANGDLDVPDPWYGGAREFARVHDIIERCCRQLLTELRAVHSI